MDTFWGRQLLTRGGWGRLGEARATECAVTSSLEQPLFLRGVSVVSDLQHVTLGEMTC